MTNYLTYPSIFFFMLMPMFCLAQESKKADSLQALLRVAGPDTLRGRLQCELADAYHQSRLSELALQTGREALGTMQKTGYRYGLAMAHATLGSILLRMNRPDSAIHHLEETRVLLKADTARRSKKLLAKTTGNLSVAFGRKGWADRELSLLIGLIPEFEQLTDSASLAICLHNVASKLINTGEYSRGYQYLRRNISLAEKRGTTENLAGSYIDMASLLYRMDSVASMKQYLIRAKSILDQLPGSHQWGSYYIYSAMQASASGHYTDANQLLAKAKEIVETNYDRPNVYNLYTAFMKNHEAAGDWVGALGAAMRLSEMADEDANSYYQMDVAKDIAFIEEKLQRPMLALKWYKRYISFRDSSGQEGMQQRIHELETQYRALEKEKKILELQQLNDEERLSLQQSRNRQLWYGGLFVVASLTSIFLYARQRGKRHLLAQREALMHKEMEQVQQQQRMSSYAAMLEGQEQERIRLARDLHDGLGGTLTAIKINLEKTGGYPDGPGSNPAQQLEAAIAELRLISRNMMPETLLRYGLTEALKDYFASVKQPECLIIFHGFGLERIGINTIQLMIYRIIQELVSNALRHANASEILVQATDDEGLLMITVEDNGKGFDPADAATGKGTGLSNIKARVDYLNGQLQLITAPGQGTTVNIECKL